MSSSLSPRITPARAFPSRTKPLILALACLFATNQAQAEETDDTQVQSLQPVVVTATNSGPAGFNPAGAELGPLGERDLQDIPYSVNVVDSQLIQNQQASSLTDLLKYLPSTQMEARGGMDVGRPQSRGMQSDVIANNHLDGLSVTGTTAYPMEMMERLEVINGLTGALYGPANPAGNFNFIQKRPTDKPLRMLTLGYKSKGVLSAHADLGGRFGEEGAVGYRLNLLKEEGESYVKHSKLDRRLISAAVDFKLREDTVLEVNASHYTFDKLGLPGSFAYSVTQTLPDAPDASREGYGQRNTGMSLETNTFSARIKHELNEDWHLEAGIGHQVADRYLPTATNRLQGNDGAYMTSVSSSVAGRFKVNSNQLNLRGKVRTGSITHDLVFATAGYDWKIYSARERASYTLGSASIDQPQVYPEQPFLRHGSRYYAGHTQMQSYTVGDTIQFNPQWSVMALGSYATIKSDSVNSSGQSSAHYDKGGFSGTLTASYKPIPALTTYLAYSDTLQEGAIADEDTANAGEVLSPIRSKQHELGLKYTWQDINVGAALFQIERPFAFTGEDNYYRVQGKQRNRGLELFVQGDLSSHWSVYGGVTLLDAKLRDTPDASTSDQRMVGVPKVQASLLAEYRVGQVPGLTLTGNLHYTGSRTINTLGTASVDGYHTIDLGARYVHRIQGKQVTWRLAVNNLTDKRYWASIFPGNINGTVAAGSAFLGEPREVRASVSMEF